MRLILEGIGEDGSREGLAGTPDRVARMYEEIFSGMEEDAGEHLRRVFTADHHEMVVEKDICFYSTCEHHLMPFYGKAHIAYIPDGKVVGISKLACQNGGGVRQTVADTGADDGSDRGCHHGASEAPGSNGDPGGRAPVYDDAGSEEAGQPDEDPCHKGAVCRE